MKKRPLLLIAITLNLVVLVALAFIYPHLMVSPGLLVKGHAALATDCFACHAPLQGARSDRCIKCHAVADVGLKTTKGVPISSGTIKGSFHQALIEQDCMACHSDHQGPKLNQRSHKPFSHGLLRETVRNRCSSCHVAPKDMTHREIRVECGQCHQSNVWKPAHFDHAVLAKATLAQCETCHHAPSDQLHRQIQGGCKSCHKTAAWKPAIFDHNKYFVLDQDHEANCETCHKNNNYSRYTCYGCHEHSPATIRAEHVEEGIQHFDNCVECHRSPRVEPERRGGREGSRKEAD